MNIVRCIIAGPIGVALFCLLFPIIEWVLAWVYKILYFVMIWGSRFDGPPLFEFEAKFQDFKSFIFVTCLATLISAGISGFIAGKIFPYKHRIASCVILGVFILPVLIFSCCSFWNSDHWFYSLVWILDMVIVGGIFVGIGSESNLQTED